MPGGRVTGSYDGMDSGFDLYDRMKITTSLSALMRLEADAGTFDFAKIEELVGMLDAKRDGYGARFGAWGVIRRNGVLAIYPMLWDRPESAPSYWFAALFHGRDEAGKIKRMVLVRFVRRFRWARLFPKWEHRVVKWDDCTTREGAEEWLHGSVPEESLRPLAARIVGQALLSPIGIVLLGICIPSLEIHLFGGQIQVPFAFYVPVLLLAVLLNMFFEQTKGMRLTFLATVLWSVIFFKLLLIAAFSL